MTERYLGWLQDEAGRVVLEGAKAHELDEDEQSLLERLVGDHKHDLDIYSSRFRSLSKPLSARTGSFHGTQTLVQTLRAGIRDRSRAALSR